MRNLGVLAVLLLISVLPAAAEMVPGQATIIPHPQLTVSGQGTVEVAPDTARITASIITEGESVAIAREKNAQIIQRAMKAVEALKMANVATKTLNYTMERVTREADVSVKIDDPSKWNIPWNISGTTLNNKSFTLEVPVTLGYRASNSLTVRVQGGSREDLSIAAGKIVDALMGADTNQITSVAYSLEKDGSSAMREALAKAVKDAQTTAEAVSAAAGRKIVGIRNINPSYYRPERYSQYANVQAAYSGEMGGGGGGTPTSVSAGMIQITAQVSINYDLDYNSGDTKSVAEEK